MRDSFCTSLPFGLLQIWYNHSLTPLLRKIGGCGDKRTISGLGVTYLLIYLKCGIFLVGVCVLLKVEKLHSRPVESYCREISFIIAYAIPYIQGLTSRSSDGTARIEEYTSSDLCPAIQRTHIDYLSDSYFLDHNHSREKSGDSRTHYGHLCLSASISESNKLFSRNTVTRIISGD